MGKESMNPLRDRWSEKCTTAGLAFLKRVPSAYAVQIGADRVDRESGKVTKHTASTPVPVEGRHTFENLVQSVPGADTSFDSVHFYVEVGDDHHEDDDMFSAMFLAIKRVYGKWAQTGALVRVHAVISSNGRRHRLSSSILISGNGRVERYVEKDPHRWRHEKQNSQKDSRFVKIRRDAT